MTQPITAEQQKAIDANIYVHSFLANAGEYVKSPHFRPENRAKVRAIVERVVPSAPVSGTMQAIDFGCGTGFMIDLVKDLFGEVHGVDITQDMMKQVDLSSGNVFLHESLAESTPFATGRFDFACAYSFMDHLHDYRKFLEEAYRVLRVGGVFYSDLNPNRAFIENIASLARMGTDKVSPIVAREFAGVLSNGTHYQDSVGLDATMLELAEPGKSIDKGFDATEVLKAAKAIGFSDCKVEYEWYLGQAKVMHKQSAALAQSVDEYLCSILPASAPLYKYLRFIFTK